MNVNSSSKSRALNDAKGKNWPLPAALEKVRKPGAAKSTTWAAVAAPPPPVAAASTAKKSDSFSSLGSMSSQASSTKDKLSKLNLGLDGDKKPAAKPTDGGSKKPSLSSSSEEDSDSSGEAVIVAVNLPKTKSPPLSILSGGLEGTVPAAVKAVQATRKISLLPKGPSVALRRSHPIHNGLVIR